MRSLSRPDLKACDWGTRRNSRTWAAATRVGDSRLYSPMRPDLGMNRRTNDLRLRGVCAGAADWRVARNPGSPLRRAGWTTTVRRDTFGKQFAPIWSRFSFNRSVTVHQESSAAENRAQCPCARDIEGNARRMGTRYFNRVSEVLGSSLAFGLARLFRRFAFAGVRYDSTQRCGRPGA